MARVPDTQSRATLARGAALAAQEKDHLAAIVASSEDAILTKDLDAIITSWNPAAERIYGYTAEEAIGQPVSMLIPVHRAGEEREILDSVLAGERVDHYIAERVRKDGSQVKISLSVSPMRNEHGEVIGASVIARDVTAAQRSQALAERLHELTTALSQEITPQRAIDVLLDKAVAGLEAAAGAVGILDPTGETIELVGSSGYSEHGLAAWHAFPLDADVPMSHAIRSGESVWTRSPEELRDRFPGLGDAQLTFQSLAVIPLTVSARPFGAVSLSFETRRDFDPEERSFLLAAAQQAANTVERARLFESERLANERLTFIAAASEILSGSLDPDTTLRRLAELVVDNVADWCGIELVDEDAGLRSVATAHKDPEKVRLAEELRWSYPVDPHGKTGAPNVIRTGQPELYPEVPEELLAENAVDDEHLRIIRELGIVSAMIVPLKARGNVQGALTLIASESGHHYDEADLELAEELARRAALAIDNAMLFRREHEAAVTLQRSLLPESLPELDGVEFAARYEPAAPGLQVGGDWYEVVPLDDGTVGVSIGDIAGHGINAASIMGRVRPALRAYVTDGHSPAEAMERLDRLMRESDEPQMTTVFHIHFDPADGSIEYVRAGHPPGLLRLPDGRVEMLAGEGTPPLGVLEDVEYRTHKAMVPPGSLLLLYTDGLIERRDDDVDAGLERLRTAFAEAPSGAEECLRWLGERFSADEIPDDVAMLAMATAPRRSV